ncbi:MAG: hypothetical protein HEP71_14980 [Roseivirga sp.]|nr:hypothetical protein [Roseivirga sp.]
MKRLFALFGTLLLTVMACSEDEGFQSGVTKVVEVNFEIDTNSILENNGVIDVVKNHDIIVNDFSEYIGNINDIVIHSVDVRITKVNETPAFTQSFFSLLDLDLRNLVSQNESLDFFALENIPFANSQSLVLYKEDSTQAPEIESAVDFIRDQLLLNETLIWEITGELEGAPAASQFVVKLSIDLTATVQLR